MKANIKTVKQALQDHGSITYGGREILQVWTHGRNWRFEARDERMRTVIREITKPAGKARMTEIAAARIAAGQQPAGEMARMLGRD